MATVIHRPFYRSSSKGIFHPTCHSEIIWRRRVIKMLTAHLSTGTIIIYIWTYPHLSQHFVLHLINKLSLKRNMSIDGRLRCNFLLKWSLFRWNMFIFGGINPCVSPESLLGSPTISTAQVLVIRSHSTFDNSAGRQFGILHPTGDGSEIRRSPVEVGSLSRYSQGFMHFRWFRISSFNNIAAFCPRKCYVCFLS